MSEAKTPSRPTSLAYQADISVSSDQMEARLTLHPPHQGDPPISPQEIASLLKEAGVVEGIDWPAIEQLLAEPIYEQPVVVARGREMRPADEGKWVLAVDIEEHAEGLKTRPDGSVDFRDLKRFNNVAPGQVVAYLRSPDPGEEGFTVTGKRIKVKKVRHPRYHPGENLRYSEDRTTIVAECGGHVVLSGDQLSLLDRIFIQGDVDYTTGNLDFGGHLTIDGNVNPDFRVRAGGNLVIRGFVEKAQVEAGGDLVIEGRVFGKGDCEIKAGGRARIRSADGAKVQVGGDLEVEEGLRHCDTLVGGSLTVRGNAGLVGGSARVHHRLETTQLGSPMGTFTRVEVGRNPILSTEYEELCDRQSDYLHRLERINQGLEVLKQKRVISPRQREIKALLEDQKYVVEKELARIAERLEELSKLLSFAPKSTVEVSGTLYPGVMVILQGAIFKPIEELRSVVLYVVQGKVRLRAMRKK